MLLPDVPPACLAAFSPAANASAIVSASPSVPFDAPTETQSCAYWPGRKRLVASSKATLPRDCENMCTDGVQPADIRIASTGMVRSGPPFLACTVIEDDAQLAAGADHRAAVVDLDAERARLVDRRTGRIVPDVDDRRDVDAGLLQVDRRRIGGIVGRVDADISADRDAIVVEIDAGGRGEHDARPVVVGEHHVPLDRAGRDDHAPGAHLPQPLARQRHGRARRDGR